MTRTGEIGGTTAFGSIAWPLAITLLAAAIRLWELGATSLWSDEAVSLVLANYPMRDLFLAPIDPSPGLYYSVQKIWSGFGTEPWVVRFPSFLFGVATVPVVYLLARRLAGPAAGVFAALLAALFPEWVHYSQEARAYALLILLLTLALLALSVAFERPRDPKGSALAASGFFGVLMIYTHPIAWFLVVPIGLGTLLLAWRFVPRRRLLSWIALGVVLVLPEIWRSAQIAEAGQFGWLASAGLADTFALLTRLAGPWPSLYDHRVLDFHADFPVLSSWLGVTALLVTTLLFAVLAIMLARRPALRPRGVAALMLVSLVFVFPLTLYLVGNIKPLVMVRTMLPFQLGVALLVGIIAARSGAYWIAYTFALFSLAELALLPPPSPKDDWRKVALAIELEDPADGVILCPAWLAAPYAYAQSRVRSGQARPLMVISGRKVLMINDAQTRTEDVPLTYFRAVRMPREDADPAFPDALDPQAVKGKDVVVIALCEGEQRAFLDSLFELETRKRVDFGDGGNSSLEMFRTR